MRIKLLASTAAPTSIDRKSTRLNSSHLGISYAVFCLKKLIIFLDFLEDEYVRKLAGEHHRLQRVRNVIYLQHFDAVLLRDFFFFKIGGPPDTYPFSLQDALLL